MQIDYMHLYRKLLKAINSAKSNKSLSITENMQVTWSISAAMSKNATEELSHGLLNALAKHTENHWNKPK